MEKADGRCMFAGGAGIGIARTESEYAELATRLAQRLDSKSRLSCPICQHATFSHRAANSWQKDTERDPILGSKSVLLIICRRCAGLIGCVNEEDVYHG